MIYITKRGNYIVISKELGVRKGLFVDTENPLVLEYLRNGTRYELLRICLPKSHDSSLEIVRFLFSFLNLYF
jgi:hypothetical protein